jgi:hypothetical protein
MTKALPFTEAKIERAIRGARAAGLEVSGFAVRPNGDIVIFGPVETEKVKDKDNTEQIQPSSKWGDVKT